MKTLAKWTIVTCALWAMAAVAGGARGESLWDTADPPTWADGVNGVDDLGTSYALGTHFTTDSLATLTQVKCWFSMAEIDEAINENGGEVFATLWADEEEAFNETWDISELEEGWSYLDVADYNLSPGVEYIIAVDTYGGYAYGPNEGDITSGPLTATEGLFIPTPGELPNQVYNLYYFRDIVTGSTTPLLQAGDADQDLDFDQLDLVQVQIAAKYLTGQPATWGDGDWNAAPGGSQGAPPVGDGQFNQLDIIAALGNDLYLKGPYAALSAAGVAGDHLALAPVHVPVPEPSGVALACLGLVALIGCIWRGRRVG